MAKYEAIGRAKAAREYAERKFRREEAALQRAHLAEMARLNRVHQSTEGAADRQFRKEEGEADRKFRGEEGAADRQFRKEEGEADRLHRSTENALNRQSETSKGTLSRAHEAEQKRLDREATSARETAKIEAQKETAMLKARAESITPESVLSALNNTSYESSDKETKDASGGYKVFSLPAWIDGQVTAAVTAAENEAERKTIDTDKEYKDKLTTEERRKEIIAEARERAGEKARVAATRAATEQANNALEAMTLKARQYVLAGETPESALKKVKKEFGSQSNSLFANHFRQRQKPTITAPQNQKTEKK